MYYIYISLWIYNIRGDIDRENFRLLTWNSFIGQFVHPVIEEELKGVDGWHLKG